MTLNCGIRSRVIFVALLPMLILALLLTTIYTSSRLAEMEEAHTARGRAFARQLVAASEYAVFSGNHESLQKLAEAGLTEDDVLGITIIDLFGETLAHGGVLEEDTGMEFGLLDTPATFSLGRVRRIVEPVIASRLEIDDEFTSASEGGREGSERRQTLGNVVLDLSRRALDEKRDHLLRTGALTVLLVLMGTLVLAISMSRGVSVPIRRIAKTVERIGQGRFEERVPIIGGGSLRTLAEGVNEMAAELAGMHAQMRQRIDEATAELRTRKDEAERANVAKSRFLAAASHDLRQPMHALGLFISELSQRELVPESRHLVEQISASAQAMEDLLDSLLDISKLDAGVLEPNIGAFPLQPMLERIEASQYPSTADQGVTIRVRPTEQWGIGDPVLVERILGNLVSNAVRYSPSGRVFVACRKRSDRLRIEVRDNGVGIPRESQAIIFDEFVQLENPERARGKGLGLGLAIVRRLTDLLGYMLEVRSEPGCGSVFAVEIPVGTEPAAPLTPDDDRLPGDLSGFRVVLVDDDPLALNAMQSLLSSWGCAVVAASGVQPLFAALATHDAEPQIVISDYRLGQSESGLELIRLLRERYGPDLPAVLITGDTGPDSLGLGERHGLPVLHKPVRPARLRAVLNRIIPRDD